MYGWSCNDGSLPGHQSYYIWMSILAINKSYLSRYTLDAFTGNHFDMNEGRRHIIENLNLIMKLLLIIDSNRSFPIISRRNRTFLQRLKRIEQEVLTLLQIDLFCGPVLADKSKLCIHIVTW